MRRFSTSVAGLSAVAVLAVTAPAPAPAVIGGRDASQPYPFMAALRDGSQQFCGASLIAPQVALTAAHCVPDEKPDNLNVLLGRTSLSGSGGEEIPIASIEVHERYDGDTAGGFDIALLTLSTPSAAAPIRIGGPGDRSLWDPEDIVRVIGWGAAVFLVGPGSDELQEVDVPVASDPDCEDAYPEFDVQTMLCAGEQTGLKDSCQGDSGGPLFGLDASGAPVQFGTVSYGLGCGFPGFYGVYGRVGDVTLREWIAARVPSINQAPAPGGSATPAPTPDPSSPSATPAPATAPVTRLRFAQDLGSARTARKRKRVRLRIQATGLVRNLRATLAPGRGGKRLAGVTRARVRGRSTINLKIARKARLKAGAVRVTLRGTDAQGSRVSVSGLAFLRR